MMTSFSVENYRGFRAPLKIDGLRRVNLIAGENDAGKTSLLEAISLLMAPSGQVFERISRRRGFGLPRANIHEAASWMFHGGLTGDPIRLGAKFEDRPDRELTLALLVATADEGFPLARYEQQWGHSESFRMTFLNVRVKDGDDESSARITNGMVRTDRFERAIPMTATRFVAGDGPYPGLIEDFSAIQVRREDGKILPAMRHADPRIAGLTVAGFEGGFEVYGDVGLTRLLPLPMMGDGVRRIFAFVVAISTCSEGVVVIDEIENGIHHSAIENVWKAIGEAARASRCQVIATTHSYECIQAAQRAFADNGEEDLAFIRLERDGDVVSAVVVDEEDLETAIGHHWEMR